jgi:hypothetical protein
MLDKARPRDRSEEELAGYRKALDWIFSHRRRAAFKPEVFLKFHTLSWNNALKDGTKVKMI